MNKTYYKVLLAIVLIVGFGGPAIAQVSNVSGPALWRLLGGSISSFPTSSSVGVASTTPNAKLTVQGTSGSTGLVFNVASSTGTSMLSVAYTGAVSVPGVLTVGSCVGCSGATAYDWTPTTYDGVGVNATSTGLWLKATSPFSLIASSTYATNASTTLFSNSGSTWLTSLSGCVSAGAGGVLTASGTCNTSAASVTSVGVSSSGSLTIGSTPVTTSGTITADLNMANANTWTALQKFSNASTSLSSHTGTAYFGGTATTTINADGLGSIVVPSTGSITITGLGTAAGTFVAADANGKLIATTSPSGGAGASSPTYTTLTATTTSTYTTPANVIALHIRMCGGGGGGGNGGSGAGSGGAAGASVFGTYTATTTANGGGGGSTTSEGGYAGLGGSGGTTAVGTQIVRIKGSSGASVSSLSTASGGIGATSPFGGNGRSGATTGGGAYTPAEDAGANSCSGGGGAPLGAGGGAGEYVEFNITNPAASYYYATGTRGAAGANGTNQGGIGSEGLLLIEEFY